MNFKAEKTVASAEHRFYFLIDAVARRLKSAADEYLLDAAGLTTSQLAALRIIVAEGQTTPNHIAATLGQQKSALTTMVRRLEAAGHVTRTKSASDGRSWLLEATESGVAAIEGLVDGFREIDELLADALSPQEAAMLGDRLQAMLDVLNEDRAQKREAAAR